MFSKACEYAIRAMIFIAKKSADGHVVGIIEIAKGIGAPQHFIAKILQELRRHALVQSIKGPNGGFYIDDPNNEITLADVVIAIDGDKLFKGCALGLQNCSERKPCPIHDEFKLIRQKVQETLNSFSVTHFNEELKLGLKYLKR
ncbi:MAG: Rrf2 family transcriptional regulator [Flavisolibacter sp.]|jgi:Rrf2 family protein|nr:Rrf2 family transcriptional regulator [Flavisolibacter sp.]